MKTISSLALVAALLLLPIAIWAESTDGKTWQNRLYLPILEPEPNRHTPIHTTGTFLPPTINRNIKLGPQDNPILLTTTTRIPAHITVTVSAGTTIYAHEFAQLIVDGKLIIRGTATKPVQLTTNEEHPLNQTWSGISVTASGQATIKHAAIRHASPAISCLPGSTAVITDVLIEVGSLGVFLASNTCQVSNTIIRGVRDGIVAVDVSPQLTNTSITAKFNEVRKINVTGS